MITTAYLDLPFFFPIILTAAYPFYYYDILVLLFIITLFSSTSCTCAERLLYAGVLLTSPVNGFPVMPAGVSIAPE